MTLSCIFRWRSRNCRPHLSYLARTLQGDGGGGGVTMAEEGEGAQNTPDDEEKEDG